jgi:ABC-type branched-chain amino acid transport systems, periplasmic component
MSGIRKLIGTASLAAGLAWGGLAAADPIKIGLLYAFSGPFAAAGMQVETALQLFLEDRGNTVAGQEVEFILRDTTGPAPDVAVRLATELITRDRVDIVTGLDFSPNAMAVASVSNRAGIPAISMNASTLAFIAQAQYGARTAFTLPQQVVPLATWSLGNDISRVYSLVADFAPGLEAESAFGETFTAGGGEIIGSVRVPIANPDFAPYMQRIREAGPDAVFVFLPAGGGDLPTLFFRAFAESGLAADGVRIIGTGETDESTIDTLGDAAVGAITAFHYSSSHDSPENLDFVRRFEAATGGRLRATFAAAQAYDTFGAIYDAIEAQNGEVTPEGTLAQLRGHSFNGLRGQFSISDAGEIVQTIYIREVQRVDGRLENIEFDAIENVTGSGAVLP